MCLVGDVLTGYALAICCQRFSEMNRLRHPDYIVVGSITYPLLQEGEVPLVTEVVEPRAYHAAHQLRVARLPMDRIVERPFYIPE